MEKRELTQDEVKKQHEQVTRQLNDMLNQIEQLKGIRSYLGALLENYKLPEGKKEDVLTEQPAN